MLGVVALVALLVQVYSVSYMRHHGRPEPRYWWYYAVMSLFAAAMLALVLADNLLLLYIAWEGVGLCSFLLIRVLLRTNVGGGGREEGLRHDAVGRRRAADRDPAVLARATGTFQISELIEAVQAGRTNDLPQVMGDGYLTMATLLVFLGAMGKSAQVPFHVWLPDAMEGPTPVSALIHAATMVVAGVYLVARLLPIFDLAPGALELVTAVGLITAILAGLIAITQTDIKKVLGLLHDQPSWASCSWRWGAAPVGVAMFHLMTHAFFKARPVLGIGLRDSHERRAGGVEAGRGCGGRCR